MHDHLHDCLHLVGAALQPHLRGAASLSLGHRLLLGIWRKLHDQLQQYLGG
jgi:hypothetical protein